MDKRSASTFLRRLGGCATLIPPTFLALFFVLCLPNAAQAFDLLAAWRTEAMRVRILAENDLAQADHAAQRLERDFPGAAVPADRLRLLILRGRIALYRAESEKAAEYARQAMELARRQGDKVGQVEADLIVALNAVNQNRLEDMYISATRALATLDGVGRPDLLSEAMLRAGMMYRRKGQFDASVTMAMQQMEIAQRSTDPLARTLAYQGLAMAYDFSGRKEEGLAHFRLMRDEARRVPSKLLEAAALLEIGNMALASGQEHEAEKQIHEAIAMFRAVGGPFYVCRANHTLADLLRRQGRASEAQLPMEESIQIYERLNNKIGLWWALQLRSEVRRDLRRFEDAQADAERAYALAEEIKLPLYLGGSAKLLGEIAMARGDHREAARRLKDAYELAQRVEREKAGERMIELAERYDKESEKRHIEALNRAAERQAQQQRWLWTLFGASLLVLAVTAHFLLRLRRTHRLLTLANTQLQRSKNNQQAILDAIPELLFELGLDGRYYECHSLRHDLLAVPVGGLLGKTVSEVLPPDAAEICLSALREAHETGNSTGKQFSLPLAQGKSCFELSVARKIVPQGEEPRFIVLSRDITERKLAEQQLWLMAFALNQVREAAYLTDIENLRFLYVNDEACRALGYSREELLGMTVFDIDPDATPEVLAQLAKNGAIAGSNVFERRHQTKDGHLFPVEISGKIFEYEGRRMSISLARDITERKQAEQKLRMMDFALSQVSEAAYLIDRQNMQFIYVNDKACRELGYSREELLRLTVFDIDPDATPEDMAALDRQRDADGSFVAERRHQAKDGRVFLVEIQSTIFEYQNRNVSIALARDITERKRMEAALREREERYRGIFDNVFDSLYLLEVTPEGRFRNLEINPAFEKSSGIPSAELIGKFVEEVVPEETANIVIAKYRRCVEAGTAIDEEAALELPSGLRYYHSTLVPVRDDSGRIHRIVGISRDITERKRAEALLHAREQEFRAMVENSPDIIARYDTQCRRVYVNPAMQALFGLPVEEILGKTPTEFSTLSDAPAYQQVVRGVFESGQEIQSEFSFFPPKGSARWGHIRVVPEFGTDGAVTNVLAITRDITSLKEAEQKIEAAYAQLQDLAARREEALEDERKRIARDMHDELGQYLTALRMGISVLRMRFGEGLPEMQEQVKSLKSLLDRTIQVVRDMAKRLRPAPLDMGVVAALEWLVDDFSRRSGTQCELDFGGGEISMSDNQATAIFRIVQESLTNVLRYAEAERVDIHLAVSGENYLLQVSDDGKGFDPAAIGNKSFGLLGIRERAAILGGEASIVSAPGQGSTVEVSIPIQETKDNHDPGNLG